MITEATRLLHQKLKLHFFADTSPTVSSRTTVFVAPKIQESLPFARKAVFFSARIRFDGPHACSRNYVESCPVENCRDI